MPVIAFASSKGGAGKTTSAIILATTLSRSHTVTLIDADPAPSERLNRWAEKAPLPSRLRVIRSRGERSIQDEIDLECQKSEFVIIDLEGAATKLNAYAMGEADLVIIPMGDEQPDAEEAIETLAELQMQGRALRREIPVRILFARTKAAVKSRLERSLNEQVRRKVGAFDVELHARTAFSSLHNLGGTLYDMDLMEISGVEKAIANAESFAEELKQMLGSLKARLGQTDNVTTKEYSHDA